MFEVYGIKTKEKIKVYAVESDKNGYPKFLIRVDNQWKWTSAKHYVDELPKCQHELERMKYDGYEFYTPIYKCKKCGKEMW